MSHPPEPWKIRLGKHTYDGQRLEDRCDIVDADNYVVDVFLEMDVIKRVVACVNACQGIPTEELLGKTARKQLVAVDVYADGSCIMMATEEIISLAEKEMPTVDVIQAKIMDSLPKERSPNDVIVFDLGEMKNT
jgi:hypothetical protein